MMRLAIACALAITACGIARDEWPLPLPSDGTRVEYLDLPVTTPDQVDLLLVIDDSPAMAPYADRLRENLAQIANVIETISGGLRIHVGVITGDLGLHGGSGDGGLLHAAPGEVAGRFAIADVGSAGAPITNFDGRLGDALVALGEVGTGGDRVQRPLDAAVRALRDPRNAGFRRPDAYLALLVITPGDDRSAPPVAALADELRGFVDDGPKLVVAGVLGPRAARLDALLEAFPNRSTRVDIDGEDWTDGVILLPDPGFAAPVASPCFHRALVAPYQCTVEDVQHAGRADETAQILPECTFPDSDRPCWRIDFDPADCPVRSMLALAIDRDQAPPDDDHVMADCLVE